MSPVNVQTDQALACFGAMVLRAMRGRMDGRGDAGPVDEASLCVLAIDAGVLVPRVTIKPWPVLAYGESDEVREAVDRLALAADMALEVLA
ncbi:hypothetical protein X805_23710 [Sphaerotilus natans subsp. natans DSM 6575]|uniref:Uncharacterized protein n=1 Tax=Sphaerotilus natans subsp. natans DSM 6575 TaxID=1286631 RepID=A0A059KKM8_9BURK|nr:hypothetical protein X805_23710 [Sphaerotilus natans subsp. natans DSM 6575]SIQ07996.1 hypothetical protein SAMN05421778_101304 [Sphaerotilus natans]